MNQQFRRLYASSATSNLADGIGRTALPLLAASYTHNAVLVSGLITCTYLPWLLFALPSGALIDRLDRRHAMAAANVLRAACTGVLALLIVSHEASIAVLYAVAFLLGLAETVYDSASRALLPQLVGAAELDRANSLLTVEETLGQTFLGAPIGSVLFATAAALPVLINAVGFAGAALLLLALRGAFRPPRTGASTTLRQEIGEGVRWLNGHSLLRGLTLISTVTASVSSMTSGILVLYVIEELRLPPADFGLVLLVGGLGSILGGLGTPLAARRFGRGRTLTIGCALGAIGVAAMAFTRNGYVGALFFGIDGAGVMVWNVLTMSLRQALIPQQLFGRVQGAYRTLVFGGIALGALAGGALGHVIGIRPVFLIAGALMFVSALCLGILCRRHRDVLAEPEGELPHDGHGLLGALPPEQVTHAVEGV
ncbi:MFS transporter [Jatrophihabitans sp.]|uniref:MFS transporter n=1 Tax=Jatrophihabitans sp. TaxID=1932789 RepID=UPI0030C72170|nr:Major facilitator superfamily Permease [Jatrophihabitans sp.]